jgi:cysteine desulfurase / selenocysteine lyase
MERIYLDHAATSWPKPTGVLEAFVEFQSTCGAAGGRGAYTSAQTANDIIAKVRSKLARLIHASSPSSIAITHNGTASLNLAISGFLKPGDHVITTAAEHNSVLRPLMRLKNRGTIELAIVEVNSIGKVLPEDVQAAIRPNTRLVAVTHASNVTGCIQPLEGISEVCRQAKARLLVDAAQTLGYIPIDVEGMNIDLLAAPGHKGACGLLGTGMLYASSETAYEMEAPWPGGTGSDSANLEGPFKWPDGFEAGNLNVPSLAGWNSGLEWLASTDLESHQKRSDRLRERLWAILCESSLGKVIGSHHSNRFVPVVSVLCQQTNSGDLSAILDSSFRIETRSGLHCAGAIHKHLGSELLGGTLRFSLGHTSSSSDLDALEVACRELRRGGVVG